MAADISSTFIGEKLDTIAKYIAEIERLDEFHAKFDHQCEVLVSKFKTEIDVFQEAPHQMDGRLPSLIDSLTESALRHMDVSPAKMNLSFSLAYLITKVRGYKVVIRHFPHAVHHMSPVMKMLSKQDPNDRTNWETKYMLLLWLSMLCLIPLKMNRFDGGDPGVPLAQSIYETIKTYLMVSGKHQDAAPFLAAKFLTRPENQPVFLSDFVDWCLRVAEGVDLKSVKSFKETGVLASLHYLYKIGKREVMSPYGVRILEVLSSRQLMQSADDNLVKYVVKLTQRIGLSFLRVKDTSWRYKRGQRILSRSAPDSSAPSQGSTGGPVSAIDPDAQTDDVPAELEEIIDCMVSGLRMDSSVTRWSAAKGIGRLTSRLSLDMAETVVEAVLDLFSQSESGSAWHGGCLCLAELGRRGLILPSQLPRVLEVVKKAAVFDECKGYFSIGSHVRDAACYVCWSFARAYDAETLKPFVTDLACSLLIVAVFDREVNCRRAAAAAFQENVGRQGALPDGIEIVTVIDYQSVGSRKHSFTELSAFLAGFEVYQEPLIRHVIELKINHWDSEIRELAAEALHKILTVAPLHLVERLVLHDLFHLSIDRDINNRHGALMSLGSAVRAFHERNEPLLPEIEHHVKNLIVVHEEKKYLQGYGSEFAKQGFCNLIECCALSSFPVHGNAAVIDSWMGVILDSIFNSKLNQPTMDVGIRCMPIFLLEYLKNDDQRIDNLLDTLMEKLRSQEEGIRCASFSVFGQMPIQLLSDANQTAVLNILINGITSGKQSDVQMAEARAAGLLSLSAFLTKLPDESLKSLSILITDQVYRQALVRGLRDYTPSFKGDIGIHVRRNSLKALKEITSHLLGRELTAPIISSDDLLIREVMSAITSLCVANQEQLRSLAAEVFLTLVHESELPRIPHREALLGMFPCLSLESCHPISDHDLECKAKDLSSDQMVLESFVRLLPMPSYTRSLWEGLVTSIGGMSVSVAKSARVCVSGVLKTCRSTLPHEVYVHMFDQLLAVFADGIACPRLTVPLLNTYIFLMTSGYLDDGIGEDADHVKSVLRTTWTLISRSGDPVKKMTAGSLICTALRFKACARMALSYASVLLCSPSSPRVRIAVAENLSIAILTFTEHIFPPSDGDLANDDAGGISSPSDESLSILAETDWSRPVAELKPIRDHLCSLFGIKGPSSSSS